MDWAFLVNCADDFEADIIIGFLKVEGIPHLKRYRGTGYHMREVMGVGKNLDILVPEVELAKAKELLTSLQESEL